MPLSTLIDTASSMVLGPNGILSLQGALVNPFTPSDPPAPTTFAETLLLDSTSLLRGLLRSNHTIRYATATAGPVTVISHPSTSRNVAVIRWASSANGKRTTVETEGVVITLDSWLKVSDWGSTKRFQRYGRQPWIKWMEKRGRWQAVDLNRRVLAVLISRKSALGTRLKLTSTGLQHVDALILTAIVTVTGPHDWRRYPARDEPVPMPLAPAAQSEHALPTYRQAPFTRPLASLTGTSLSVPTIRRPAALSVPNITLTRPAPTSTSSPSPSSNQPVTLTLSSHQLLSGVFSRADDGKPEIVVTTIGPYTTLARYVTPDDWNAAGNEMDADGRVLKRIANIEWVSSSFKGKRLTRLRMRGQKKILDEVMYSSNPFFESRERRFGSPNFLPWITWTESSSSTSRASSSLSLSSSSSSSVRYLCRSHPDGRPLAVLSRRLTSAGTQLELTPEGWDILDAVLITGLLVVCGSHDWKRVAGIGVPVTRGEEEEEGMAVGEEMVTGLDGWTSPPELVEIGGGGASGAYTPRRLGPGSGVTSGAVTPGGMGLNAGTPVGSRTPSPPPYLP